ncbi:MAG: RsmD family RNA methyltransferase, partial [Planctomycetia bacterium]|nr:RsmD family RNA methyltransferase [Planctomycetia bacterium]
RGGAWGGTGLFSPPGRVARPALAKVRAAIFNVLSGLEGVAVLDLYAGTGALGFEALSRGAARATFFERDAACAAAIRASAEKLRCGDRARLHEGDVAETLSREAGAEADLAFADPPYALVDEPDARAAFTALLSRLRTDRLLRPGGWLVVEHRKGAPFDPPHGFALDERRAYGQTALAFLRAGS